MSNPSTGKDTKIELVFNGLPQKIVDCVTNFSAQAETQKRESRFLGSTEVNIQYIPDGWSGTIEVERKTRQLDDFVDQVRALTTARIPFIVLIADTTHYEEGASTSHIYPDVQFDFSTMKTRGEAQKTTLAWRTGKERI